MSEAFAHPSSINRSRLGPDEIVKFPHFMLRSQLLDEQLVAVIYGDNREQALAVVNEKRFSAKHTDVPYRILNHWANLGLLADERAEHSQDWRKFSLTEVVWLRIVKLLREYGLSLEKIKVAQQALMFRNGKPFPTLEAAISLCTKRIAMFAVILIDGNADVADPASLELTDRHLGYPHHLRICLNHIVQEIAGDESGDYSPSPPRLTGLSEHEKKVLKALRSNDVDAVRVSLCKGSITGIDMTKKVDSAHSILETFAGVNFGEVNIRFENGKPVHAAVVKKERVK